MGPQSMISLTKAFLDRDSSKNLRRVLRPRAIKSLLGFVLVFYVGVPLWFYLCPWMRRAAVYLHFADWPLQTLSHPEYYGLNCTRHFFVETSPGVVLGVWHILPRGYSDQNQASFASDNQPVVMYLHGSAESRSAAYRRSMYKVLSNEPIQAHIITFDYRGFGDSTYITPTAKTLEEDAASMFEWLQKQIPASRIIIWGHSMGTGIAVRLGAALAKQEPSNSPMAIVLEAPFTSIADATRTFPLSFFHRNMPLFETFCTEKTRHPDTNLDSESLVGGIRAPLLILHAEDDSMVWSVQGKTLWKIAIESRPADLHKPVFVELDGKYGCGHRNIHKAPNLGFEVKRFLKSVEIFSKAETGNS
ncbi:hypothetical protein JTE90_009421 [Oedothorax gibbosus]|uniref:AB hydrolase-1 domain-containing protein n=1 Tax=Oedothorax gibbosus TaxID=931172 RepID=A0AAV6VV23_9ARAC|nr:hypothetical protein JTE90_009421 [Oedothorax gibbosus]